MQLLILVLTKTEALPSILSGFYEAGLSATTVAQCEGGLHMLGDATNEPPPIFGVLRRFLNPHQSEAKLMLSILEDGQVPTAKAIIDKAVGGIENPNTGVICTLPISSTEGLANHNSL
ncbi:MAG: hypothetical protein IKM04_04215 [Clostridia bacterium]|nr:hypothetical protein [Clostridia bacterium]